MYTATYVGHVPCDALIQEMACPVKVSHLEDPPAQVQGRAEPESRMVVQCPSQKCVIVGSCGIDVEGFRIFTNLRTVSDQVSRYIVFDKAGTQPTRPTSSS